MIASKILVWNVRGLNKTVTRNSILEVVNSIKPDIVCLQETKVENLSCHKLLSIFGAELDGYHLLPTFGTRGGVLIAWKSCLCWDIDLHTDTFDIGAISGARWALLVHRCLRPSGGQ